MIQNNSAHGMVVKHFTKRNIFGIAKEVTTVVYHPNNSTLTVIKGDRVDEINLLGPGIEGHLMVYEDFINWEKNEISHSPIHVIDASCHVVVGVLGEKFDVSLYSNDYIPNTRFQVSQDEAKSIRAAQIATASFLQDGVFFGSKSMNDERLLALKPFIWHDY